MTRRPNILLITADQWRGECIGAAGHPAVQTPNLDALAGEATLFRRHYAACAPCSPARAALYTGLYQMTNRVVCNGTPLDARFDNIAKAARRAGYRPTLFGYTDTSPDPRTLSPEDPALRSYEGVLPGMEVGQILPEDDGPWLDWLVSRGHDPAGDFAMQAGIPEEGEVVTTRPTRFAAEESQTAFLTGKFLDWISGHGARKPWFAHLSFLRPHPPFSVPAPYNTQHQPGDGPAFLRAPTRAEEPVYHPAVEMRRDRSPIGSFVAGQPGLVSELEARDFDRIRAIYYGMISEVDAQIGRLIDGLKAAGQWEDTLLVFTSDHAEMMGDHWMLGKGGYFEQSYHIPLIVKVPGQGSGGQVEAFTSAVDIFPTLIEAMDVAPEHAPNGASLLPFCAGGTPEGWRKGALWEWDYREMDLEGPETGSVLVSYRTEQHLYVHCPNGPSLLFDTAADPACLTNIADQDLETRLQMAEALLGVRAANAEQTLARHKVWEWHNSG